MKSKCNLVVLILIFGLLIVKCAEIKSSKEDEDEKKSQDFENAEEDSNTEVKSYENEIAIEKSSGAMTKCGCGHFDSALESLTEMIKELRTDVKMMKEEIAGNCTDVQTETDAMEKMEESFANGNATELEGADMENENNTDIATTVSSIPIECDLPFQPLAEGCYFFLYHPQDWRLWGDAQAYCQSLGGVLASPSTMEPLRHYLVENFSNVFWIGAQIVDGETEYKWYNGEEFPKEEWAAGQPSTGAKNCVVLDSTSRYKAMNNYCGQKFPFICQRKS